MKIVLSFCGLLILPFFAMSQEKTGDAIGSLVITKVPSNYGGQIPYYATVYTNSSSKKINLFVKVQMLYDCVDGFTATLEPGEKRETVQPPCKIVANFVQEPVKTVPPKSSVENLPTVKIEPALVANGNYRLRNSKTGKYLLIKIDSLITNSTTLVCDSVTSSNWEEAKWTISSSNTDPSQPNLVPNKECYRIITKKNEFSLVNGGPLNKNDKWHFYAYNKKLYEEHLSHMEYGSMVWQFVKKAENTYQIKVKDHYIYLDADSNNEVICREILGEPTTSFWILERCE